MLFAKTKKLKKQGFKNLSTLNAFISISPLSIPPLSQFLID